MTAPGMDEAALRRLIREVLHEVLRDGGGDALRDAVRRAVRTTVPGSPTHRAQNPDTPYPDPRHTVPQSPTHRAQIPDPRYRVDAGAVTERRIVEAVRAGATSVLIGRRAVLTPLARDKARALGLTVHREA